MIMHHRPFIYDELPRFISPNATSSSTKEGLETETPTESLIGDIGDKKDGTIGNTL
jgi:hypothetical protein